MGGSVEGVGPEVLIIICVVLDEAEVEQCVEVRQLVQLVPGLLAECGVDADESAILKVGQNLCQLSVRLESGCTDDLVTADSLHLLAEGLDYPYVIFRIAEEGGVEVLEFRFQLGVLFKEDPVDVL